MDVAVVTDSTACVPPEVVDVTGLAVVPLQVIIDGVAHREGVDLSPGRLVDALRSRATVTTSQPAPEEFARVYERMAARGAREVVSVHLSGDLSGTVASARLAAETSSVPVHVVDSRTVAMGLGFAALGAAHVAAEGADADAVARAAADRAHTSSVRFAVDSLEHLRRGGRLGPVAATLGTVLGLRPVLGVRDGRLEVVEKVRTSVRARSRLVELTLADVRSRGRCEVAVHHLGRPEVAEELAESLRAEVGSVRVAEVSAVLGAHVGPGVTAVVVADA